MASLNSGDDVESVPTLDVKRRGDKLVVYDQDGRNRALAAQQAGVDLIPVSIRGLPKSDTAPQAVRDMRGEVHPFDFERALSAFNPIGTAHAEQAQKSPAVAAGAWEPSGAAQPLSGGEWASAAPQSLNCNTKPGSIGNCLAQGCESLAVGTAQLGAHLLPQGLLDTVSTINRRIAALEGQPAPPQITPAEIDAEKAQFDARVGGLEAQPHAAGVYGVGRLAGALPIGGGAAAGLRSAADLLPQAVARFVPTGASLLGRAGQAGVIGGAGAAALPAAGGPAYPWNKGSQIASAALLGSIADPATEMAAPLVRWAARLVGLGKPTAAAEAVISRIARSPAAPTAQDMMDIAATSAKPMTLANMSRRLASLAGRVSRSPGSAADIVQQNLAARASARGARVYSDVAGEFGGANLYEASVALSEARSAAARPLFEAALQPGSTAPLADMFRSHATEAMRDYQAAVAAEEAAAGARGARSGNPDLIRFLIARGGVKDAGGELRAMDLHRVNPGWFGRLSRQNGMSLDRAREAAEEAGYLRHGSDIERPAGCDPGNLPRPPGVSSGERSSRLPAARKRGRRAVFAWRDGVRRAGRTLARRSPGCARRRRGSAAADRARPRRRGRRTGRGHPGCRVVTGPPKILDLPVMQAGIRKGIDIERMRAVLPGAGPFRPRDLAITGYDREGEPIVSGVLNMRVLHAAKTGLDTILEGYRSPNHRAPPSSTIGAMRRNRSGGRWSASCAA